VARPQRSIASLRSVRGLHRYRTVPAPRLERRARRFEGGQTAPTWSPQTAQENWSDRRARGNFIKAWGVSSPCAPGRVMPTLYGARLEEIQRSSSVRQRRRRSRSRSRRVDPRSVILDICRIELGPSRRDPQGTLTREQQQTALQGASAMGGTAVTRRVSRRVCERQPSGLIRRSTTFDFGVSVATRMAHANRAFVGSFSRTSAALAARSLAEGLAYASNHRRGHDTRRCSLQNGLPAHSSALHEVSG
jgi:hypothetical protein